jgi:site-specific DNA-methyltransferase (adenine-specific)
MELDIDTIHNENCLITMVAMANGCIDLVVTSPPYDDLRTYEGYSFDFEAIAAELYRVIKPGGVIVWVVGDATKEGSESGTSFKQALHFMSLGANLHDTMIYEKNSSTFSAKPDSNRYTQIFEYMFIFSKGKPQANLICDKPNKWAGFKDYSGNMTNPVREYGVRPNIWRYITSQNSTGHPAPYPEELAQDHILTWSNEGDLVYDPFMGSGTTAKMAILNKRHYIGSEISANYCDIANKRIPWVML